MVVPVLIKRYEDESKICFEHIEFTLPVARLLEGDLSFFTGRKSAGGGIADRSL